METPLPQAPEHPDGPAGIPANSPVCVPTKSASIAALPLIHQANRLKTAPGSGADGPAVSYCLPASSGLPKGWTPTHHEE
jgi:hypothetical protein